MVSGDTHFTGGGGVGGGEAGIGFISSPSPAPLSIMGLISRTLLGRVNWELTVNTFIPTPTLIMKE